MGRKSKAQRYAEIHAEALQRFDDSFLATQGARELARICRRFVNVRGAQWDWDQAGQFDNKMKLEIDHVSQAVQSIKNEYRRNAISAAFIPADGEESEALSDACAARFRADTQNATGREARKTAFDCAVEGGFAGLRLKAEYERGEYQKICLEPIYDPEATLFFDANAKRADKSDAEHAFLITPFTRRAFVEEYGEDAASWPQGLAREYKFAWFGNGTDLVYVAEYFVKEDRKDTYRRFEGILGEVEEFFEDDLTDEKLEELTATGFVEIEPRVDETHEVCKYLMSGAKILQDKEVIPGPNIPLVPQYGIRTVIDHAEYFYGRVMKSMDPQIVYNIQVSKVGENAAASGIEKPIFTPEQIGAYAHMWQNDNIDNNAFLLINPITGPDGNTIPSGPLGYTKSPDIPPAVAALITITRQDVADQMGNPENSQMLQPDASGVALDAVQSRLDMNSYNFMDNAADAERRLAEVWLGMASVLYADEGRVLATKTDDGKRGTVEIGKMVLDKKTGKMVPEVDFSRADMEVDVDVGPTSSSRRQSIVRTLAGLLPNVTDPEMAVMMQHMLLMNIDGEGVQPMRDYSRKRLIAMGVVEPTKEEQEAMAAAQEPPQPDPQAMLADALAMEAKAKAMKAQADTMLAAARTEETQAKTAATLAGIPIAQQEAALRTAQAIAGELNAG